MDLPVGRLLDRKRDDLEHDAPDEAPLAAALRRLAEARHLELDRLRQRLLVMPRPTLSVAALDIEQRRVRHWRAMLGLAQDEPLPIESPAAMRARIERAHMGHTMTKEVARSVEVLGILEAEGWDVCGLPDSVAGTKASFYIARKQLLHEAHRQAERIVEQMEKGVLANPERDALLRRAGALAAIFERYPPDVENKRGLDRKNHGMSDWGRVQAVLEKHPHLEPPRRSTGKRDALDVLRREVPEWRQSFWSRAVKSKHADALAALMASGCRPLELVHGVRVTLVEEPGKPDRLTLRVNGVKITRSDKPSRNSGQEWREVDVLLDSPETQHLAALVRHAGGPVTVCFDGGPDDRKSAGLLKATVARIGTKIVDPSVVRVTPYVFRHLTSTALKRSGLDDAAKSQGMGHLSERTIAMYGKPWQGGKSCGATIVGARAAGGTRSRSNALKQAGFRRGGY